MRLEVECCRVSVKGPCPRIGYVGKVQQEVAATRLGI